MKIPTRENIEIAKQIRHKLPAWEHKDELLYREFKRLNKNVDFHEVAYKIALLDGLYGCNLRTAMDEWDAAEFIINTKIDDKLRNEVRLSWLIKLLLFLLRIKEKGKEQTWGMSSLVNTVIFTSQADLPYAINL